jgi:hypothetical protein
MIHIKRKFLLSNNVTKDGYEFMVDQMSNAKTLNKNPSKKFVPHILTTEQKFIQGFFYELNSVKYPIPEPNPIIIYFSNAQGFLNVINEEREKLFTELKTENFSVGNILNYMFGFYGCVVNYSSSLFDSLEAFVNSKIPKDFKCENPKRRGKIMNKYEIIRHTSFEEKVKTNMTKIYNGKNFAIEKGHLFDNIMKLKKLRDNITHAKADLNSEVNYYEKLFTEALNFDYLKAIESARDFINYYEENLIEPCDCGLPH